MLFNSFPFIYLLLSTFILFYATKDKSVQLVVLLLSSMFFYAFNNPILLLLLLSSAIINVLCTYYIVYGPRAHQKVIAVGGVIMNLSVLIFFKYGPLLASTFWDLEKGIGHMMTQIPLPIGISFFTFQGISLVVDVYSGKHLKGADHVSKDFKTFLLEGSVFIMFFPQLIAGPIVKAHEFLPQIRAKRISSIDWEKSFKFLVCGYFFKMVVADNLNQFTFYMDFPYFQYQWSGKLLVMLFGYSCQIFADFAGYSMVAIGLALLFGYEFNRNFLFPYISQTFSEFWRRWHISLSTYLKEYLYIPLGGNRKGKYRTYLNLFITMVLGGFWHGASWSYAVWGLFHGIALALERLWGDIFGEEALISATWWKYVKMLFIFCAVTLAWLLFKLPDFSHVVLYIEAIFNNYNTMTGARTIPYIIVYCSPVILFHFGYLLFKGKEPQWSSVLYGFMLFMIFVNSGSSAEFIYFQF